MPTKQSNFWIFWRAFDLLENMKDPVKIPEDLSRINRVTPESEEVELVTPGKLDVIQAWMRLLCYFIKWLSADQLPGAHDVFLRNHSYQSVSFIYPLEVDVQIWCNQNAYFQCNPKLLNEPLGTRYIDSSRPFLNTNAAVSGFIVNVFKHLVAEHLYACLLGWPCLWLKRVTEEEMRCARCSCVGWKESMNILVGSFSQSLTCWEIMDQRNRYLGRPLQEDNSWRGLETDFISVDKNREKWKERFQAVEVGHMENQMPDRKYAHKVELEVRCIKWDASDFRSYVDDKPWPCNT